MKEGLFFDIEPEFPGNFPVLPLRDIVVFPLHVVPLFVGREKSVRTVEHALKTDKMVFLTAQKEINIESPVPRDLYSVGTIGLILRMMRSKESPDKMKILVQGICKARILEIFRTDPVIIAALEKREAEELTGNKESIDNLITIVKGKLDKLIFTHGKTIPADILVVIENLDDTERLAHLIAGNVGLAVSQAQEILEICDPLQKLIRVDGILDGLISRHCDLQ